MDYNVKNNSHTIRILILLLSFYTLSSLSFGAQKNLEQAQLSIYNINGLDYLSVKEFAEHRSGRTEYYDHNNKLVMRFPNKKVVLSGNCSFIKVNDRSYQISSPVLVEHGLFFVPAVSFSAILVFEGMPNITPHSSGEYFTTLSTQYNIHSVSISKKDNGGLIRIGISDNIDTNDLAVSFSRGGWMSLTVQNGVVDSLMVVGSRLDLPVRRVRCMQNDKSAQISFLLQYLIEDYEINVQHNEIVLSIRSNIKENADKIREMRNNWLLDTIVIDAGHGGKDPGAIGANGVMEKTITLDIAIKLGRMINKNMGAKVVYTREEDVFIPLWQRTKMANASGGKLFISIHANSTPKISSAQGFETYLLRPGKTEDAIGVAQQENSVIALEEVSLVNSYYNDENIILATMAQNAFMKESESLAALIQEEMEKYSGMPNRGVKQAGFHVLVGASMPNVLVEIGFLSNRREGKMLGQSSYRKNVAQALFSAIVRFKNKYEGTISSDK